MKYNIKENLEKLKESDIEEREKKDMIKVLTIPFIIKQLYPEMPLDKYEKLRTDIKFLN